MLLLRCVGQGAHERSVSKVELKKKLNNQILTFMAMARTVASATSRTTATATYRTTITATTIGHIAEDALAAVPWSPGDTRPRTTTLRLLLLLRCVGQGAHERSVSKVELKHSTIK